MLNDIVAEKDEQIHSLEKTVNDMTKELKRKDRQISFVGKAWVDMARSFCPMDQQVRRRQ